MVAEHICQSCKAALPVPIRHLMQSLPDGLAEMQITSQDSEREDGVLDQVCPPVMPTGYAMSVRRGVTQAGRPCLIIGPVKSLATSPAPKPGVVVFTGAGLSDDQLLDLCGELSIEVKAEWGRANIIEAIDVKKRKKK